VSADSQKPAGGKITQVLDKVEDAADAETVSLGEILDRMGSRSFAPLMLLVALVMVSPVSGVPGASSVAALIIGTILLQMVLGRDQIWMPGWLKRRSVKSDSLKKALDFMRRPVAFVEPLIRPRLQALTRPPGSYIAVVLCFALLAGMPLMDFVPTLSSVAAVALALFAAGFLTRDGVFMVLGYLWVGAMVLAALAIF
jgi:hypothetical protein